jgi:uncharacterized membrane protein YeaQ/YmgE (transglycosylase-associated protein family)
MSILGWIVLGLIAGAIAKLIMPGHDPGRHPRHHAVGHHRSRDRRFLGSRIFAIGLQTFWNLQTWIVAIIGSLILLVIYRLITRRRAASH